MAHMGGQSKAPGDTQKLPCDYPGETLTSRDRRMTSDRRDKRLVPTCRGRLSLREIGPEQRVPWPPRPRRSVSERWGRRLGAEAPTNHDVRWIHSAAEPGVVSHQGDLDGFCSRCPACDADVKVRPHLVTGPTALQHRSGEPRLIHASHQPSADEPVHTCPAVVPFATHPGEPPGAATPNPIMRLDGAVG